MSQNTFATFQSMEEYLASNSIDRKKVAVAKTTNGALLLTAYGRPIATIHNELKGSTPQETARKLASVNITFGIPHPGSKDNAGRPSLPCAMESKSQWEEVALF